MKNKLIFHFKAQSGVSLNNRFEHQKGISNVYAFNFGDTEIYIKDSIKEIDKFNIFDGLDLFINCEDESEDRATERAKILSETVLSLISFVSLSYICPAKLLSVLNTKENKSKSFDIKFNVFSDEEKNLRSLTKLNKKNFTKVWNQFNQLENKNRLLRSISWLRKGFNEKSIDQFLAYFIGIEILSKPLNMLFDDIGEKNKTSFFSRIFNCKKISKADNWTGVRKVFKEYLKFDKFKKIKDKRNEIMHGYKKLDNCLIRETESYIEILKKALITSLCLLLNLEKDVMDQINEQKWAKFNPSRWFIINGSLNKIPDKDLQKMIHFYPHITQNMKSKIERINKKGEITLNEKANYNFIFSDDIKLDIKSCELWGENNSGIINMKINNVK